MRTKIINSSSQLAEFIDCYNKLAGNIRYHRNEFTGLHVRAFFIKGIMVAGYVINDKPPYRTLEHIPKNERETIPLLNHEYPVSFAEVNALWIKKRAPNRIRALVYCLSVIDCFSKKKDYILGGCLLSGARRTQMRAISKLLWAGESKQFGRLRYNWVFYSKPLNAVVRLPYAVLGGWMERISKTNRAFRWVKRGRKAHCDSLEKY